MRRKVRTVLYYTQDEGVGPDKFEDEKIINKKLVQNLYKYSRCPKSNRSGGCVSPKSDCDSEFTHDRRTDGLND